MNFLSSAKRSRSFLTDVIIVASNFEVDESMTSGEYKNQLTLSKARLAELIKNNKAFKIFSDSNKKTIRNKSAMYTLCRNAGKYNGSCRVTKLFHAAELKNDIDRYIQSILNGAPIDLIVQKEPELTKQENFIKSQIEKIDTELKRAQDAYLSTVFDLDEYLEIRQNLEKGKNALEKKIKSASAAIPHEQKEELLRKNIRSARDLYKEVQTAEEKRTLLKSFIRKIVIYQDIWGVIFYIE